MQQHAFELPSGAEVPGRLNPPAIDRLGEISVPTLVMVGEYDVEDFHTIARILERQVHGAGYLIVPGVAHLISLEKPDDFNDLALDFLANCQSIG